MIRRSASESSSWQLISQVEHARLAGELAAAWKLPEFGQFAPYDPILYAIGHHDDGWADWELRPGADAQGRPINFDEMPLAESLSIWRRSIDLCAAHNFVAGHAVAGHFMALLQRFTAWQCGPVETRAIAVQFLKDYEAKSADWLAAWPSEGTAPPRTAAEHAVGVLQLFDAMSLWLCCQDRSDTVKFLFPGSQRIEFAPVGEREFRLSPWPLVMDELRVSVPARQVAVGNYAGSDELLAAGVKTVTIDWRLHP